MNAIVRCKFFQSFSSITFFDDNLSIFYQIRVTPIKCDFPLYKTTHFSIFWIDSSTSSPICSTPYETASGSFISLQNARVRYPVPEPTSRHFFAVFSRSFKNSWWIVRPLITWWWYKSESMHVRGRDCCIISDRLSAEKTLIREVTMITYLHKVRL